MGASPMCAKLPAAPSMPSISSRVFRSFRVDQDENVCVCHALAQICRTYRCWRSANLKISNAAVRCFFARFVSCGSQVCVCVPFPFVVCAKLRSER